LEVWAAKMSTQLQQQAIANTVSIPFYALNFVCNAAILVIWCTAPKLHRNFYNRLVVYQAVSDGIWGVVNFVPAIQYSVSPTADWALNHNVCIFFGIIRYIKLFYTFWDGFVAVVMYRKIVLLRSSKEYERTALIVCLIWTVVVCTLVESVFPVAPSHPACGPTGPNQLIATELLFLLHIYLVILCVVICYVLTIRHVYKIWRTVGNRSEDQVHKRAIRHLIFFPLVDIIIWTPSIVRRSYEPIYGYSFVGNIWQNVCLPLSGPLNLFIWGFTRKVWRAYPFCSGESSKSPEDVEDSSSKDHSGKDQNKKKFQGDHRKQQPQSEMNSVSNRDVRMSSVTDSPMESTFNLGVAE